MMLIDYFYKAFCRLKWENFPFEKVTSRGLTKTLADNSALTRAMGRLFMYELMFSQNASIQIEMEGLFMNLIQIVM